MIKKIIQFQKPSMLIILLVMEPALWGEIRYQKKVWNTKTDICIKCSCNIELCKKHPVDFFAVTLVVFLTGKM